MKYFNFFILTISMVLMLQSSLVAQKISGMVMDEDQTPLIGVSIIEEGTSNGTITDIDGKFTINLTSDSGSLVFSYLGYQTQEVDYNENTNSLSIEMAEESSRLEEVVVTGLATTVKRKNLANSVARIESSELTEVAAQTTLDAALYGKFKGAEIKANSGAPGGGLSFKLRGITSINGSSQPLIILDGTYIDNSSIASGLNIVSQAAGGGSQSNQDNPSNRLADLDPNDIESVEILKGASAAAIYGSRASGGVIIINTKRGTSGETRVSVSQSIGQTSQLRKLGVRQWTEERVLNSGFAANIEDFRNNPATNYEDLLYGNRGLLSNTRVSIRGGNNKTQFFIGGTYKNEEGIVNNTGYEKASGRVNIDHKISKVFDLSLSSGYTWSSADRGFFNNDNSGTTMGVAFSSTPSFAVLQADENGNYPNNPYAPSNFLQTSALITNNEEVSRLINGVTLTTKILTTDNSSLRLITRGGMDFYNLNTTAIFPNSLQFQSGGAGLNGVSVQGLTENLNTNLAAFLVHSFFTGNNLTFTTSAGVTSENFNRNTILGEATNMIGTQTNLDQGGNRNVVQNRLIQRDNGFFVQEEFNYQDKFLATVGIRGDRSSNNGDVNQFYYYPKANVAINLHEFGLFGGNIINSAKLRAAYGEAGNFAIFGAKNTTLGSVIINGSSGVVTPTLLGNSNVGPERQKETEFGVDIGLFNRFLLDATYYIKNVEDLLVNADVPTSTGFTSRVTNAAKLQNKGIEIGLSGDVVKTGDFKWNTRVNWWKNNSLITELLIPAYTTGGFADFLGQLLVKEGYSPTTIIGVGPDPDVTLNGDGDPTLQIFGNAEPDFQMGWFNNFTYKNLSLAFNWHWKKGGDNINLSALLFDLNGTTHDYDDTTLDPDGELTNGEYRNSVLGSNTGPLVEDASYIRLREIGLYYKIPMNNLSYMKNITVGISGNNLINIFDYNSYDPEVSNFGSGGLSTGVEVLPFPSSKRWDVHVKFNF